MRFVHFNVINNSVDHELNGFMQFSADYPHPTSPIAMGEESRGARRRGLNRKSYNKIRNLLKFVFWADCILILAVVTFMPFLVSLPLAAQDSAVPLIGLNYGPFRAGQWPGGPEPSMDELEADVQAMAARVSTIRLYSSTGVGEQIVALANQYDLDVIAQAWIGPDRAANETEVAAVIELANTYDNVVAVLVGSEVLLRGDVPANTLVGYIEEVQAGVTVPVGYADILPQWQVSRRLNATVDWVGLHSYGFWGCQAFDNAVSYTMFDWKAVSDDAVLGSKPIKLMETGWPSAGYNPNCDQTGAGDSQAQAQFTGDILLSAYLAGLDTFVFQYADEPWKCDDALSGEGTVGCYWGLVDVERQPKPAWELLPDRGEAPAFSSGTIVADVACQPRSNPNDEPVFNLATATDVTVYGMNFREAFWLIEHDDQRCWVELAGLTVAEDYEPRTVTYFNE